MFYIKSWRKVSIRYYIWLKFFLSIWHVFTHSIVCFARGHKLFGRQFSRQCFLLLLLKLRFFLLTWRTLGDIYVRYLTCERTGKISQLYFLFTYSIFCSSRFRSQKEYLKVLKCIYLWKFRLSHFYYVKRKCFNTLVITRK